MRKLLTILPIAGLLVFGVMLNAGATEGECATFENHSGHVPGSYDYAEFYEDGQLVTTVETHGEDLFVDPAQYDAGRSWDQVKKCQYTTTTTSTAPQESSTTIQETTSTTEVDQSTTTTTDTSTTTPSTSSSTTLPAETTTVPSAPTTTMDICESEGEVPDHCLPPDAPELPFTGPAGLVGLAVAGLVTLGIGVVLVREFGE